MYCSFSMKTDLSSLDTTEEMASVKDRSQTLQLKVMMKDEEEEVKIWEYDDEFQEKSSNYSHQEEASPASVKQHQEASRGNGPHPCPHCEKRKHMTFKLVCKQLFIVQFPRKKILEQ
ncbi:hypothetical protein DPEC_G00292780 [Dallia pectoralis]|uniref:Uncharacterized protein n=1 Tax=Dallia pectoralis TaxID=75939 RepID=A0ACC2FI39_DALPE|nr:hypothetical protein DPEC_G00292780 [Dallia pectoralis]